MPALNRCAAVVAATVLTVQPVAAAPARASAGACIIVWVLDAGEVAQLPQALRKLLMVLVGGDVSADATGAVQGGAPPECPARPVVPGSADDAEATDGARRTPVSPDAESSPGEPRTDRAERSRGQDTGDPARKPGDLLDLDGWFLTLPTGPDGGPESIDQPELLTYSSEYFGVSPDGDGVVFRAPTGGVTTENSEYPRSELREMIGEEDAAWSSTSGTHTLEVRQAITEVPPAKPEVVAAQIHDGDDDVLQIRLEGSALVAQYADGQEQISIDPAYRLGTPYDLRIVVADGRVTVFYNGEQRAEIASSGTGWYWKVGAYPQSNPDRGDGPGAAGEVVVYSLTVEHAGG